MTSVTDTARALAAQDGEAWSIAAAHVNSLSQDEIWLLAVELLAAEIEHRRREEARSVEQQDRRADRFEQVQETYAVWDRLRDRQWEVQRELSDGLLQEDDALTERIIELDALHTEAWSTSNRNDCGPPRRSSNWRLVEEVVVGGSVCEVRYESSGDSVAEKRARAREHAALWDKSDRERRAARKRAGLAEYGTWVDDLEAIMAMRRRFALVAGPDLLASEFATGDGRRVTWGKATIEEHRSRVEWQVRDAAGSMADAERHAEAILLITEAGAACLDEVDVRLGRAA